MGYFDAITSKSFKSDADGNTVFFPYGILGKGRVVADLDSTEQVKKLLVRFYMEGFGTIFLGSIAGFIWMILAAPFLFLWYDLGIKKILKDASISDSRLSIRESMQNVALGMNKYLLWFFVLGSFLFVALSIFIVIDTGELLYGLGGIFFAVCGSVYLFMLRSKSE